jgi:hypothetical protein
MSISRKHIDRSRSAARGKHDGALLMGATVTISPLLITWCSRLRQLARSLPCGGSRPERSPVVVHSASTGTPGRGRSRFACRWVVAFTVLRSRTLVKWVILTEADFMLDKLLEVTASTFTMWPV